MNNIYNLFSQMIGVSNDPKQIIQNLINNNPQMQVIFNQMQQSGMSPKDYALQYAKQNNININPMINMLQKRGIRL